VGWSQHGALQENVALRIDGRCEFWLPVQRRILRRIRMLRILRPELPVDPMREHSSAQHPNIAREKSADN